MTTGKTATELEAMLMEGLRDHPSCAALYRVVVTPAGDHGAWTARAETKMGMHIMYECARAMNEIAKALSRDYHLQHDAESPPRR
jgi:hypothetical protein